MNEATSSRGVSSAPASRLDRFLSRESISLFTYGTLLFPEVLHALLGREPQSKSASVGGWRVAALKNRTYPGLVAAPGEITHGRLLTELNGHEWRLLDNFEDCRYELRQITLIGGQSSLAYIWVDDAETCSKTWDPQAFASTHLAAYVERCAARHGRSRASA